MTDWAAKLLARGGEMETCWKCTGSGYGGHPDSGALCPDCNGSGGVRADLMAELVGLLQEARTDLQSYVDHDYPPETCAAHPSVARHHFRDMELCRRIDAALAKIKEPQK